MVDELENVPRESFYAAYKFKILCQELERTEVNRPEHQLPARDIGHITLENFSHDA